MRYIHELKTAESSATNLSNHFNDNYTDTGPEPARK